MRTLATPRQEQSGYLDELSMLLTGVPYPHIESGRSDDDEYGVLTALVEVEAWLDAGPNDAQPPRDRHSFVADVTRALSLLGPWVNARTPAAGQLSDALRPLDANARADREPVRVSLVDLYTQLGEPDTSVAAFDDLVDAVSNPDNSPQVIASRLGVLTGALQVGDRASAETCRILGAVLDDQALEISIAHRILDGTPVSSIEAPDEFAGLAEEDRLDLARRFLRRPAEAGHHVVWVAYDDARIAVEGSWRQQIDIVEFFDGPMLLDKLSNSDAGPLPPELLMPNGPGGHDIDLWPKPQHRHWVAARVDLGTSCFSNPIQVARAQADAIVQLASLAGGRSTWTPLAGSLHLMDDVHYSSQQFHKVDEIGHRIAVDNDSVASEFPSIASKITGLLPVTDPRLRRLLREISALNISTKTGGLDLILREVAVIESVTRLNQRPPTDWPEFLAENVAIFEARKRAVDEIYGAVSQVLNAFSYPGAPHLNGSAIRERMPDGRTLFKWKEALDLMPQLLPGLPDHHAAARRLREVARRTEDVTHLATWIDELAADCRIKIKRAARLRNGLSHAGAAPDEVAATIRLRLNRHTRLVARAAVEAVVAGTPVKQSFDSYRTGNRRWRQQIPTAANICDAIFDRPTSEST